MRGSTAMSAACGDAGAAREHLVDLREALAQRVLRDPLQVQIERRVDVDGAGRAGIALLQLLADVVDEVRRLGSSARATIVSGSRRPLGGVRADEAGVGHRLQDDVAALLGALGIAERRQARRRLDDAGDRRRLGERDVATSLPKNSRAASATPWIANEPRWPSETSFRYSSRIWSFVSRARARST